MDRLFFSKKLDKKLDAMLSAPLSVVEAPTGYGKTSAVRHAMEGKPASQLRWYTAVESESEYSFNWFVRQLEAVDELAAEKLQALLPLNRSNAFEAADILSGIHSYRPLYLVLDNFQYISKRWPPQVLAALAARTPDGLHIIIVGQELGRLRRVVDAQVGSICCIRAEDLALSREDLEFYAERLGLTAPKEELDEAWAQSSGWPVAVTLYLQNLRLNHSGALSAGDTDGLLNELLWQRLNRNQRRILLRLGVFERLRPELAQKILRDPRDYQSLKELLNFVPLLGYHASKREYFPHEILRGFLCRQLEEAEPEFRREVYSAAGEHHLSRSHMREAAQCFFKAEDWEGVLRCELTGLMCESFEGRSFSGLALAVLEKCPEELLAKYPLSTLRLCHALYGGAGFWDFERHMSRVRLLLNEQGDRQLLGEWTLLAAFLDFPDLEKMESRYRQAGELMSAPSRLFTHREPFMFGSCSMWYLFYNQPGEMMLTAKRLSSAMQIYNRLTDGHGAGAAELYLGEALSVQCRFEESDIQAYQAALLAENSQNASVMYGAALLLGINAIYQGDMLGLQKAIDYLESRSQSLEFMQGLSINARMVETVRSYLLSLLMEPSRAAQWTQAQSGKLSDLSFTNFMAMTCRVTDLVLRKEYRRAIASLEASLQLDPRLITLPTRNFMYAWLSLCYLAVGYMPKALEYLEKSLSLSEQDKNFSFLASFRRYFSLLFLLPPICTKHGPAVRDIKAMNIKYTRAEESSIFPGVEQASENAIELTEREREIAEMVAKGMRNSEIAKTLHVSDNTVKTHLKTIFRKLNIDRRSRLVEMLK